MARLETVPKGQKKINCIWIGNGSINHLGAFNILSWIACGWTVTIYKHPAPEEGASVSALFPMDARSAFYHIDGGDLSVVSLSAALEPETLVMPNARTTLRKWVAQMGVGYTSYAIGDLAKSFIAGTRVGIVLDLKIGPSKWVHDFPADRFLDSFISFTRAGAGGVENQCLGSFHLAASNKYGTNFDSGVAAKLGAVTFAKKDDAEAVFGVITGLHQLAFNKLRFGGGPRGTDVKSLDSATWAFDELVHDRSGGEGAVKNSGPFRVYQTPGFFNWKQGEYPEDKKANELAVADTLRAEHGFGGYGVAPGPLVAGGFYYMCIQPMAAKAIKALDPG